MNGGRVVYVPGDYRIVPVPPSTKMTKAGMMFVNNVILRTDDVAKIYTNMVSASPHFALKPIMTWVVNEHGGNLLVGTYILATIIVLHQKITWQIVGVAGWGMATSVTAAQRIIEAKLGLPEIEGK